MTDRAVLAHHTVMRGSRHRRVLLATACGLADGGSRRGPRARVQRGIESRADPGAVPRPGGRRLPRLRTPTGQDPATGRRRACKRHRRRRPRAAPRQGAGARGPGARRRPRRCAPVSLHGLPLQEQRIATLEKALRAARRQDFRALSVAYVDFILAGPKVGSPRERDRHPSPAVLARRDRARGGESTVDSGTRRLYTRAIPGS